MFLVWIRCRRVFAYYEDLFYVFYGCLCQILGVFLVYFMCRRVFACYEDLFYVFYGSLCQILGVFLVYFVCRHISYMMATLQLRVLIIYHNLFIMNNSFFLQLLFAKNLFDKNMTLHVNQSEIYAHF